MLVGVLSHYIESFEWCMWTLWHNSWRLYSNQIFRDYDSCRVESRSSILGWHQLHHFGKLEGSKLKLCGDIIYFGCYRARCIGTSLCQGINLLYTWRFKVPGTPLPIKWSNVIKCLWFVIIQEYQLWMILVHQVLLEVGLLGSRWKWLVAGGYGLWGTNILKFHDLMA